MANRETVRGLERGFRVLEALERNPILSLQELHLDTGISKPALLRLLQTLDKLGLVSRRLGDGRYRSHTNLTRAPRRQAHHERVAEAAAPVLDRLCQKISWPSDLFVPAGDHLLLVETSRSMTPFLIGGAARIGWRVNWMLSAVGRVYLAYCPAREREQVLRSLRKSEKPEDRLAHDPSQLDGILAETRKRGYGIRAMGFGGQPYGTAPRDDGLAGMALPLLDGMRVHGTVNILWVRTAMTIEEFAKRHLADLQAAAQEIVVALKSSPRRLRP
jgi:IclR family transcriptional regulator, mhp operon transcriptional activator